MGNRAPNERLAGLHRETGWTLRQFAQAVNRIGTECGTPTTYSAQTAHSWLKGHIPATPEVRQLVIEALARKLKRPVSHTDVGFPVPEGRANGSRVRSGRCDDKIRDMFSMIRPHLKNRVARELYERAREVAPNSLVA
ncbi:hypothetical protein [Streptomyces hygroscopicus]|uniref:hypothetical protein n=1 Tax=Streptomyces hygroscopicus TaxID=1912 RepID=UPI000A4B5DEC|nr:MULTISPECIES: hypothetical protein [Streptomyces]